MEKNCSYELENIYKLCIGRYCGRLVLNQSECVYSECGVSIFKINT